MNELLLKLKAIYDLIQDQFNELDLQIGQNGRRNFPITGFPQLARDLYLVHDVVAISCDAGTMAWVHYHHDEEGWIECACEAFNRIGHPSVGEGMRECLATYLVKRGSLNSEDDRNPSDYIIDHEEQIMRDLHAYLVAGGFAFARPSR